MISFTKFIHIFLSGPLLIYLGIAKDIPDSVYISLFFVSIMLILLSIVNLFENPKAYWFYIHLIIFSPLLLWVSVKRNNVHPFIKSLLLAIGVSAFGYHLIRIWFTPS
jgi:hypothetical protein